MNRCTFRTDSFWEYFFSALFNQPIFDISLGVFFPPNKKNLEIFQKNKVRFFMSTGGGGVLLGHSQPSRGDQGILQVTPFFHSNLLAVYISVAKYYLPRLYMWQVITCRIYINAGNNYFPHLYMRQVITCRIYKRKEFIKPKYIGYFICCVYICDK